jgi:beta-mannosidase
LIDEPGTTFCFEINNVPFFVGGSNWIPLDSVLSNATEERYRRWLELLVEGNQSMVRVWGGGIYEDDRFYDICVSRLRFLILHFRADRTLVQDELGILVWQDFAFACGAYPAHPRFLESVKQEAIANVKRLRSHPSLALFAGNNED